MTGPIVEPDTDPAEPVTAPASAGEPAPSARRDQPPADPPPLCSLASRWAGDEPAGTASTFTSFLLLDHRAPWSAQAALDAAAARLSAAAAEAAAGVRGLRIFAIRPVRDRHTRPAGFSVLGRTGATGWLDRLPSAPTPAQVNALAGSGTDLDQCGATGATTEAPEVGSRPLFAVCTNGRRDRCCAISGRRIAEDLHAEFGSAMVEISHLGGHRFAGTIVVLPWGYAYGYLDSAAARQVARAAADGLVHPGGLRGRADRTPIAQAADAILRTEIGPHPPAAIGVITEISEPGAVGEPALLRARVFGQ